ncbi:MAG: hypothetical protein FD174_2670 [Geobacteraceae bacterium]|nr:MAG: hypothetical protein FD174_2670 [Geobacteraceae bacterium]
MDRVPCGEIKVMHAYPQELVSFLLERWDEPVAPAEDEGRGMEGLSDRLPDPPLLERLISTCYQASLMHEEERPVNFRLIVREPELFVAGEGPPDGLHRLIFTEPRPFNEYELQRLSPAADFYRSLIGVRVDPAKGIQMWGLVHSGPRWMQSFYGGKKTAVPLPPSLVLYVTGPGRIAVCRGSVMVASLNGGQINCPSQDIFTSRWLPDSFASVRAELLALHREARGQAKAPWAELDPNFIKTLSQQVVKRIISNIRNTRHGGTLIYLPQEQAAALCCENRYMTIKYQFTEEEPRQRFRTLLVAIMNTFAAVCADPVSPQRVIGWRDYAGSKGEELARLDKALFEVAHLIAGLAAVDGAVVMSKRHELLGFGAVISGDIDKVETVARALDNEGEQTVLERSEGVGTRHRAAYRLCHELHDAIAIVVSQDGSVQVVKWHNGIVTFWNQVPTGVIGF